MHAQLVYLLKTDMFSMDLKWVDELGMGKDAVRDVYGWGKPGWMWVWRTRNCELGRLQYFVVLHKFRTFAALMQ
jgi:hypothetical protein